MHVGAYAITMTAAEAAQAIGQSTLSDSEKAGYLRLITAFPDVEFFAATPLANQVNEEDHAVKFPDWFKTYRMALAGTFFDLDAEAFQFDGFTTQFRVQSPLNKRVSDLWFAIDMRGLPGGKKERNVLLKGSTTLKLFPIGAALEDERYQLAVNLKGHDTKIYQYHLEDIWDAVADQEDISTMVFEIFASPGDMYAHIAQIRVHEGEIATIFHA